MHKNSPRAVFCVSKPELVFIEVDPGLLNAAGAVGGGAEEEWVGLKDGELFLGVPDNNGWILEAKHVEIVTGVAGDEDLHIVMGIRANDILERFPFPAVERQDVDIPVRADDQFMRQPLFDERFFQLVNHRFSPRLHRVGDPSFIRQGLPLQLRESGGDFCNLDRMPIRLHACGPLGIFDEMLAYIDRRSHIGNENIRCRQPLRFY